MLSSRLGIEDVASDFMGKTVLVRVDYNVPIAEGKVSDDTRVIATVPTIKRLFECGAKKLVLMSHCGRPDGQKIAKYTLQPVAGLLERATSRKVFFLGDCVGPEVEKRCKEAEDGSIILLENLRFHVEEEGKGKNEDGETIKATKEQMQKFGEDLAKLGDIYVNDAFGTAHRAHSSMVGIKHTKNVAGLLLKKECDYFAKVLEKPQRPFLAILGGAKIKDKIALIESLMNVVDCMIIGGGMAYTFKVAIKGMSIGDSLYESDGVDFVKAIMKKAAEKKIKIVLPSDFVCANKFAADAETQIVTDEEGIPQGWMGLDCGPASVKQAESIIMSAKQIMWNGPQGVFEMAPFAKGSLAFVDMVAEATKKGAISIIGGGDTAALVQQTDKAEVMSHISTGGGAALELLEGKVLPGILALSSSQ